MSSRQSPRPATNRPIGKPEPSEMKPFHTRRTLPALIIILVAFSQVSAEPPAQAKKGVTIEGITEYALDNGMRVLLFPDPSATRVTINLTVLVGSRHEG